MSVTSGAIFEYTGSGRDSGVDFTAEIDSGRRFEYQAKHYVVPRSDEELASRLMTQRGEKGYDRTAIYRVLRSSTPTALITPEVIVINRAGRLGDEEWVDTFIQWFLAERANEKLSAEVENLKGSVDAYRKVNADLQEELKKARAELGRADPIDRNRTAFLKLLTETFSISMGPLSVNLSKFSQLMKFIYTKPQD